MNLASLVIITILAQTPNSQPVPQQQPNTQPAPVAAPAQTAAKSAAATTKTYSSDELGLEFDYPKKWKKSSVKMKNDTKVVITDPKSWRPSKVDSTTRFLVPLPGADEKAVLELFSVTFNQDVDTWQAVQRDINEKLKRTVLRQWSEEILGVPLLMTKIESKDRGVDQITETGLMYSATPRKLIFRLTSSPDNFDKADYQWRQVLQTIRTTDGQLPSAEDPNRKLTPQDLVPGAYHKVIWTPPAPAVPPLVKGDVLSECTSGGKKVLLRAAGSWKAAKSSDGSIVLTSPEVTGSVKVFIANDLDSDNAGRALMRASGRTLDNFSKVLKREEKGPYVNSGLANVDWIYRKGFADAGKPLYSFDAAGANGDDYWVLTWISKDPGSGKDRKALESLVGDLHIEPGS